jgi:hypothetical protein
VSLAENSNWFLVKPYLSTISGMSREEEFIEETIKGEITKEMLVSLNVELKSFTKSNSVSVNN